jgi:hypothetical protein
VRKRKAKREPVEEDAALNAMQATMQQVADVMQARLGNQPDLDEWDRYGT